MIDCSFCLKPTKPKELNDCDLNPLRKCLENLCDKCYSIHKDYHLNVKDSTLEPMLEQWDSGKRYRSKGNFSMF
jgi:hypothetical protein